MLMSIMQVLLVNDNHKIDWFKNGYKARNSCWSVFLIEITFCRLFPMPLVAYLSCDIQVLHMVKKF